MPGSLASDKKETQNETQLTQELPPKMMKRLKDWKKLFVILPKSSRFSHNRAIKNNL